MSDKVMLDRSKPDVLRVTEYVLRKSEDNIRFSLIEASNDLALNGISIYKLGEILRTICLEPQGQGSLTSMTTVDTTTNKHATQCSWSLNSSTYFSYQSYLSTCYAEKANIYAKYAFGVAALSLIITCFSLLINAI